MNKQELVDKVAKKSGLLKKDVQAVIDLTVETVMDAVKKGDKVTLVGFGTFTSIKRKARKGRNPQTGKEITIPAKKSPKFTAGKAFKDKVK
ncbi:MAG: HU family DNA-binding protein [Deferribacteraceae bacterium]|jgi:DNA-binding protein HU-beta|nr:HU family DNA-binding protein [Deferribacteraceae bacterium]